MFSKRESDYALEGTRYVKKQGAPNYIALHIEQIENKQHRNDSDQRYTQHPNNPQTSISQPSNTTDDAVRHMMHNDLVQAASIVISDKIKYDDLSKETKGIVLDKIRSETQTRKMVNSIQQQTRNAQNQTQTHQTEQQFPQ